MGFGTGLMLTKCFEEILPDGVFSACSECPAHCCSYTRQDKEIVCILLMPSDIQRIRDIAKIDYPFFTQLEDNTIELMWKGDNCIFLEPTGCILKENKPLVCKIYPYALVLIEGECYIRRDISCCYDNLPWKDDIVQISTLFHKYAYYNATDIDILSKGGYLQHEHFIIIGKLLKQNELTIMD